MNLLQDEPVALTQSVSELVRQIIGALVIFNIITWEETQVAAFLNVVSGILAVGTILYTRASVTPNSRVRSRKAA
jgi:hypothetical protein